MSVRLKKAAKSLRRLFGLSQGVRPARADEVCTKLLLVRKYVPEGATEEMEEFRMCGVRAHVVEAAGKTAGGELVNKFCLDCMKVEHKPRHDQKNPQPVDIFGRAVASALAEIAPPKYDGAVDERMSGLWKRSREIAATARLDEKVRRTS